MMKRILSMALVAMMVVSLMSGITFTASAASAGATHVNQSHMLKVKGNKLVWEDDESVEVVLSGVNLPGGEWTGTPGNEKVDRNIKEAMDNWHCNVVRVAVGTKGWNAEYDYMNGNSTGYKNFFDKVIDEAEKRGKYVILDLHEYGIFDEKDLEFWKEAAVRYKNNPTVLFGILNEPTPASWDIWRDGDSTGKIGHQKIVEAIRDLGARNVIVAGGRSYAKNTDGIVNGYALIDRNSKGETNVGNGIMYDTHWYAWHGYTNAWNTSIGPTRMQYPMLMGEFGWDAGLNKQLGNKTFNPGDEQYHDKWFDHLEAFFDDYETYDNYMNFTAYSFHPSSAPAMLQKTDSNGVEWAQDDYGFTPTDYHGVYVQRMLENRAGTSRALNKTIIDQSKGRADVSTDASLAVDNDPTTGWKCSRSGNRYFTVDLGSLIKVQRYVVRHGEIGGNKNAKDFQLMISRDNVNWVTLDSVTGNEAKVTDRYVVPTSARYVKFNISAVNDSDAVAAVYDFKLIGIDSDGLDVVEHTPPQGFDVSEHIVERSVKTDFAAGNQWDDWSKEGYVIYLSGEAENKVGSVLELSGLFGETQVFGCGTGMNMKNFEAMRFKYSSTADLDFQINLHYRVSGVEKLSNKITLPNTNGEWTTIVITPEDLMPTANDTWIKTDLQSQYNMTYGNFEPVVKFQFTGDHTFDEYTRFEFFDAVWYGTADYEPAYFSVKGSMNDGFVEVATRWQNNSGQMDGLFNFMCMYDNKGNLIDMVCEEISIPANQRSGKYYLSMTMPQNISDFTGYKIKLYTWRSANGGYPVCEAVTISPMGEVSYQLN